MWKIVKRLVYQDIRANRLPFLAIATKPLDVVLYETPVLVKTEPPHNPLRGFIQEAVLLLEQPTAAEIASFFHLPEAAVQLVLGNLQQLGGVTCDATGRWSVPPGAPNFTTGRSEHVCRRKRQLLCYWPDQDTLLPVLPRMRLRDLVSLDVHKLEGELAAWYGRIASWSKEEAVKRGRPASVHLLPLRHVEGDPPNVSALPAELTEPVPPEDVLVTHCPLDVVALASCSFRSGVWEVVSRLWSRPTSAEGHESVPFASGEEVAGLSWLERLLGNGSSADTLGHLFDFQSESWHGLVSDRKHLEQLQRVWHNDTMVLIVKNNTNSKEHLRFWGGLMTTFAPEARLLCYSVGKIAANEDGVKPTSE